MDRRNAERAGPFKRGCGALVQDVTLGEGEAAGFAAGEKGPAAFSLRVSLDGVTLELGYPEG